MYHRGARPPKEGVEKIVGYVTVQPDKYDDSDNESDDDDEEWLDEREMTAISLGGTLLKQTSAKNQRITIKTFGHKGKSFVVKGRFPLHDPWWKITCYIYRNKSIPNMYFVDHTRPILLDIRTDELVITHKLVNICLTTTQEPYFGTADDREHWNEKLTALDKYVREHPNESTYFNNLKNLLKNFDELCEKYETSPIRELVDRCDGVKLVYGAVEFPLLFTFLAQLLPKKFTEIIKLGGQRLKKLDNCREEYTWEFAFSNIMFKQYGMIGVEASLYDYLRCDLLNDMPSMNCDAIYIYDFLKKDARESGHTFIEKFRIRKSKLTNDHQVVNWDTSLKYLEQHRIIKTEGKDQTMKIYLRRNWEAERDVAKTLGVLLKDSGSYCENDWNVDFTSSDFENVHNDVDQWKAAHLIVSNPVAVLSGKGGCGKTTVVTQLLKHVCENSKTIVPMVAPTDPGDDTTKLENGDDSILNESLDQTASSDQSTQFYKSPWKSYRQMTQAAEEAESSDDDSDEDDDKYLSSTPVGQTVLLTAPTGKAANLLGRKACMESVTLHHVIMSYKGFCKRKADYLREMNKPDPNQRKKEVSSDEEDDEEELDDEEEFMQTQNKFQNQNQNNSDHEQNQDNYFDSEDANFNSEYSDKDALRKEVDPQMPVWKYKDKSVLVVDECSLVSVRTIATVMNNLRRQARLRKVILLGDVRQLPSVEPGNFLADIFRVLYPIGCCMELRTNHRAESELIVNNASKISLMKLPQYDNSKFQLRPIAETEGEIEIDQRIKHLLRTSTDLHQETSQFVSFQRRRCESINELCCKFYNNHVTKDSKQKYLFQVGDKVCLGKNADVTNHKERLPKKEKTSKKKSESRRTQKVLRNGALDIKEAVELTLLDSDEESINPTGNESNNVKPKKQPLEGLKKDKKNKSVKLCNGEIFFIVKDIEEHGKDGKSTRYLVLSDKEQPKEKLVCVNYRDLVNKCKMRHGWARTIHTYQGSESSAVVYVVYRSYYENWQHVYTAVTRGRNSVYMVGKKSSIDKAIRTDKKERRTSLKEKLMKRVEKFPEILQKQKENLDKRLLESHEVRQRKINEGEDGEADLFGSDDDNDNYINALCDLLPPSQSSSEDNSKGTVLNMPKCALEQNVACEFNLDKEDNSELIEDESSFFDSDDSYMKTLDESAFIFNSQIQESSEFTQLRNHKTSPIPTTPESQNGQSSGCVTPNKENAFKRLSSMENEHASPQKVLCTPDPSTFVSPVRRCLEKSLTFSKE